MLVPGSSLIQRKNSAFERSVSQLLGQQGFFVPRDHLSHQHFWDILDAHPSVFGLTRAHLPLVRHLLRHLSAPHSPLHSPSLSHPSDVFPKLVLENAKRLTPPPYPSCPVLRNLWHMRVVADLLGLQIKLFTEFGGVLSSRKVGAKSHLRVYLLVDLDDQYILLDKGGVSRRPGSPDSSAVTCGVSDADQATCSLDSSSSELPFDSGASQGPIASAEWLEATPSSRQNTYCSDLRGPKLDAKTQRRVRDPSDRPARHLDLAHQLALYHRIA